jgi:hypothetical protein
MDVLCVFDAEGTPYCTEFYVKFRSAFVDEAALASLGANEDAGLIDMVFPNASDKEIAEAARKAHSMEHPLNRNDRVQVSCNGHLCRDVNAFIGRELILHFYDDTDGSYAKTPTSNVLKKFNLSPGKNTISCQHTSSKIVKHFLIWRYEPTDRIVIMDIDGTITKSDVTGYIQTVYMGMFSHVHEGIVPFLNALKESFSFHMLYVTARPLAHQKETKQLLAGVRSRTGQTLPDGPLLPNKDRLMLALYREMISKTTMQLKSDMLLAVKRVFAMAGCSRRTPFVLGIGNKEADARAYNLAGLEADNILIINKSSRIEVWKHQQLAKIPGTGSPGSGTSAKFVAVGTAVGAAVVPIDAEPGQGVAAVKAASLGITEDEGAAPLISESINTFSIGGPADIAAKRRSRSEDLVRVPAPLLSALPPSVLGPSSSGAKAGAKGGAGAGTMGVTEVETDTDVLVVTAAADRGEFTDSSSEGSASPFSPPRAKTGAEASAPTGKTGTARAKQSMGRGIMRAFSHGTASAKSAQAGASWRDSDKPPATDDMPLLGATGPDAHKISAFVFQTYGDPRLLQYVHSISQI